MVEKIETVMRNERTLVPQIIMKSDLQSPLAIQGYPTMPSAVDMLKHLVLAGPMMPVNPGRQLSQVLATVRQVERYSEEQRVAGAPVQFIMFNVEDPPFTAWKSTSVLPDDSTK